MCSGSVSKIGSSCRCTPQAVLEGVGESRSVPLDCVHPSRGLQSGVREGSSINNLSQCDIEISRSRETGNTGQGDLRSASEGSSRGGVGHIQPGVLFKSFPGSQEDRGSQTHHRSEYPEHLSEVPNFQDGISGLHSSVSSQGLVDLFHRPQGCISSRTNSPSFQEVHENLLRRQGLSVPSSTVRTVPCSLVVHEDSIRGQGNGPFPGHPVAPVPRRLVVQGSHPGRMYPTLSSVDSSHSRAWLDSQFRQVRSGTQASLQLHRDQVQSDRLYSVLDGRQSNQAQGQTFSPEIRSDAFCQPVATGDWQYSISREAGSFRSPSYETLPLASFQALERAKRSSGCSYSSVRGDNERNQVVVGDRHLYGRTSGSSPSRRQDLYRRMYDRMGSPCGRYRGERYLERPGEVFTHQRAGDESCSSRPSEYQSETSPQHTSFHRQHVRGSLCEPSGRHQVSGSLERDCETVPATPERRRFSKSGAYSREIKRHRGHVVEGRSSASYGMVSEPVSGPCLVPRVGRSSDRSLRDEIQSQVSCVRVSSPGLSSICNGRTVDGLEPSVGICLPPSTHSGQGHSEDQIVGMQGDPSGVSMVSTTILSGSPGAVSSSTVPVASTSRPVISAPVRGASPPARDAPTPRLAAEYRTLEERGFSKEAATRISAPQAKSSLGIYEARWRVFASWCQGRGEDPFKASAPLIADFLLYLFQDKKRRPTTITGYRTAIAGALRSSQGVDYGKDSTLTALILSFFREQPKPVRLFPAWDLSFVLKVLLKAPFEPLHLADMKYVTWKTTFLVLLASGSRRGEVHSFDFKKVRHASKWTSVTLEPHASFVSKTQLRSVGASSFSAVTIPALGPLLGPGSEEERGLCPVRAIKVYLDRTKELREDRQLLFISYKAGHKGDIHKNTISSWIRKLLHWVYSSAPEDVIQMSSARTHEVRALASSMAFRGSMELEEVLKACTWKSANTFATHYLRDVSSFEEDLHSLGPLVAAQSVIHPPERS